MRNHFHIVVLSICSVAFCQFASATPANKKAFEKYFGPTLPSSLAENCSTCHVEKEAHGATKLADFPHNPFGNSIAKTEGNGFADQLDAALKLDPDGDGRSSLIEYYQEPARHQRWKQPYPSI